MTTPQPARTLPEAIDALVRVGVAAGLAPGDVRAEGRRLAAGIVETSRQGGVHRQWQQVMGGTVQDFFDDVSRGRRFGSGPTALLSLLIDERPDAAGGYARALCEVATSAAAIPGAPLESVGRASLTGAAQLRAVGAPAHVPGVTAAVRVPDPDRDLSEPTDPTTAATTLESMTPESMARWPAAGASVPGALGPGASGAGSSLDLGPQTSTPAPPAGLTAQRVFEQLSALTDSTRAMLREQFGGAPGAGTPRFPEPVLTGPSYGGPGAGEPAVPPVPAGGSGEQAPLPQQAAADEPTPEPAVPPVPEKSVEELLAELDELIGLARVKREVHRQVAMLKMDLRRQEAGLKTATVTRHLVFVGNPGTGKTTVARLVGGIYHALGLLDKGQLIEVDRSELVAGYLGQTAEKTVKVVDSAQGGVLFIDEAYTLAGDQYGQEAVDTLVKEMEDRRSSLVVIVAGYPEPMARFIDTNPGLASRFRTTITFDDYSDDEVTAILESMAAANDYDLEPAAVRRFREILAATPRDETFGNGRFARNTLEGAIGRHAWRLQDVDEPTTAQLRTLQMADLEDLEDFAEPVDPASQGLPEADSSEVGRSAPEPSDLPSADLHAGLQSDAVPSDAVPSDAVPSDREDEVS